MADDARDGSISTVVVGVDGSASSLHALQWAAQLFGPGTRIDAVHAVSPSLELAVAAVQVDSHDMVAKRRVQLRDEWTAGVRDRQVEIDCHVVEDDPAPALRRVAAKVEAGMIVVGAHARAQHGPRRVGSTITQMVDTLTTPLAIVPLGSELTPSGTVVVGVHVGTEIRPALRWAVGFATAHHLALSLVRTGSAPPLFSMEGIVTRMAEFLDPSVLKTWALEDLAELADEIQRSTDEDLTISLSAPGRRRGPKLVEASADAALLVLDARPDPTSPTPSWLHHALSHAPCPVVLFPAPGDHNG